MSLSVRLTLAFGRVYLMTVSDQVARSTSTGLLGDLPEFRRDPLGLWLRTGIANPVTQLQLGPNRTFWSIADADLIEHILQHNHKKYPRHHRVRTADRMGGPETVFNAASWEEWLWRTALTDIGSNRNGFGLSDFWVTSPSPAKSLRTCRSWPAQKSALATHSQCWNSACCCQRSCNDIDCDSRAIGHLSQSQDLY